MKPNNLLKGKLLLKLVLLLSIPLIVTNCRKKNTQEPQPIQVIPIAYEEENPLPNFLSQMPNNNSFIDGPLTSRSAKGYIFKPSVKGKINAFIVKLPVINAALEVSVWDLATKSLIRSEVVDVSAGNTDIIKTIPSLQLEKDKEYIISYYAEEHFAHSTIKLVAVSYPVISGNIQILGTRVSKGTKFPDLAGNSYEYLGDVGFKFQRTE